MAFAPSRSVTAQQGAPSGARPPGTNYKGPAFTFNKIADGVYHAVGTGSLVVMSNATIIEGDRDVLVVDSHVSPGGAWALREEPKAITPKPIRWVVNSHYHFDHSHGNQIYGREVEIIGHEFARAQILAGTSQDSPAREFYVGGVPNTIKALDSALAASDADVDWSLNDGILEIECEDGSKLIVNRHVPNREIWVAAKRGGFHFGATGGRWRDTRSGAEPSVPPPEPPPWTSTRSPRASRPQWIRLSQAVMKTSGKAAASSQDSRSGTRMAMPAGIVTCSA